MRFSKLFLKNWRNFGSVQLNLQNRAFLIGPNASGKSNFLDVFRFLREIVIPGGGLEKAVDNRGGVSRVRSLSARYPSTDIVIEVDLHEGDDLSWRYRLAFNQDNQRRPIIEEEKVWKRTELLLNRPDADDEKDKERLRQTYLEQTIANRPFRDIAEFFGSVHYYHLIPQLIRDPDRSSGRPADPFGGDFLEQIAGVPKKTREARLRRILKALKIAIPQLSELKLERDQRGIAHLYGKYEHWRGQGAWQTEADFSDGTLRLLALLWSLLDGTGPLLLEEPELSLHSEIVRHIPRMMLRIQRTRKQKIRQILLSTHSSDLLQDEGIAPDEILLFLPSKEGSRIEVGTDVEEVRVLLETGLTAAEVAIPYTRPANAIQLSLFGN
ncbi:MAG: AAA family ATPase [Thermodesulfobacteriota bacterium]